MNGAGVHWQHGDTGRQGREEAADRQVQSEAVDVGPIRFGQQHHDDCGYATERTDDSEP